MKTTSMKDILENALFLKIQPNCGIASYKQGLPARGPSRQLYPRVSKGQWHSFDVSARGSRDAQQLQPWPTLWQQLNGGCDDWCQSDRDKFFLRVTRNHERLLFSSKPSATEKLTLCSGSEGACSRTIALSLHPGDCLMLHEFSVGIWMLLGTSDGHRHIQSTLLANV